MLVCGSPWQRSGGNARERTSGLQLFRRPIIRFVTANRNAARVNTAFLPSGHLDLESAVTAQDDEFKDSLIARIHAC